MGRRIDAWKDNDIKLMLDEVDPLVKHLPSFLHKEGALKKWLVNSETNWKFTGKNKFAYTSGAKAGVACFNFRWEYTPEGVDYWRRLNNKRKRIARKILTKNKEVTDE